MAVRFPTLGCLASAKVTVNCVVVASVTVPSAPLLSTTALFDATGSNPNPAMVTVAAFAARGVVTEVTTGATLAT